MEISIYHTSLSPGCCSVMQMDCRPFRVSKTCVCNPHMSSERHYYISASNGFVYFTCFYSITSSLDGLYTHQGMMKIPQLRFHFVVPMLFVRLMLVASRCFCFSQIRNPRYIFIFHEFTKQWFALSHCHLIASPSGNVFMFSCRAT